MCFWYLFYGLGHWARPTCLLINWRSRLYFLVDEFFSKLCKLLFFFFGYFVCSSFHGGDTIQSSTMMPHSIPFWLFLYIFNFLLTYEYCVCSFSSLMHPFSLIMLLCSRIFFGLRRLLLYFNLYLLCIIWVIFLNYFDHFAIELWFQKYLLPWTIWGIILLLLELSSFLILMCALEPYFSRVAWIMFIHIVKVIRWRSRIIIDYGQILITFLWAIRTFYFDRSSILIGYVTWTSLICVFLCSIASSRIHLTSWLSWAYLNIIRVFWTFKNDWRVYWLFICITLAAIVQGFLTVYRGLLEKLFLVSGQNWWLNFDAIRFWLARPIRIGTAHYQWSSFRNLKFRWNLR